MRSIEEIDAELADVDRQIAMRDALGYKMARTKAILDHDTSDMNRIYSALTAAEQNRIAREAQQAFATKQMEAQQAFQAGESEKSRAFQGEQSDLNRAFQSEQNELNRALQRKQRKENMVIEQAKLLKALQDRYAEWEDVQGQVGISNAKKTAARTAVELARKQALELGVPEKDIDAWKIPAPAGTAAPDGNETPAEDLSKEWTVAYNNAKNELLKLGKTAKNPAEVDSYMKKLKDKFGNDASITKELNELVKLSEDAKVKIKGRNDKKALVAALKQALKDNKIGYNDVADQKTYPITVNNKNYSLDIGNRILSKTSNKAGYPLSYGGTPLDTLWSK